MTEEKSCANFRTVEALHVSLTSVVELDEVPMHFLIPVYILHFFAFGDVWEPQVLSSSLLFEIIG